MMLTNLADVLRGAGLKVVEQGNWKARGGTMSGVRGVLWHHTATSARAPGDYPSMSVVLNGNGTTPGPLCNLGLGRNGTWYCVAAGRANHAGLGSYAGIPTNNGNAYLIGVEAEHPGTAGNPWPAAQLDSYRRGTAALLKAFGLGAERCIAHKEWAPNRKTDPYGLDMRAERAEIARLMNAPSLGQTPEQRLNMADAMQMLTNIDKVLRGYSSGDSSVGYTIPRSPERFRTFRALIPPRMGRVTGDAGEVFASIVAGEEAQIREIYAEEDWQADGKPGRKFGLQGAYKLVGGDRQSFNLTALGGNVTQLVVVYQADSDLTVNFEIDAKWKV